MKTFYYFLDSDGEVKGPMPLAYFKVNKINPHSLVWHGGLPQWVEAHTVPSIRKYQDSEALKSFSTKRGIVDLAKEIKNTPEMRTLTEKERENVRHPMPKTWMFESILITIFCCLPTGIVSLIYSSRVTTYWKKGFYGEAFEASWKAAFWVKLTVVISIILWIAYFLIWTYIPFAQRSEIWYNNYFTN